MAVSVDGGADNVDVIDFLLCTAFTTAAVYSRLLTEAKHEFTQSVSVANAAHNARVML